MNGLSDAEWMSQSKDSMVRGLAETDTRLGSFAIDSSLAFSPPLSYLLLRLEKAFSAGEGMRPAELPIIPGSPEINSCPL